MRNTNSEVAALRRVLSNLFMATSPKEAAAESKREALIAPFRVVIPFYRCAPTTYRMADSIVRQTVWQLEPISIFGFSGNIVQDAPKPDGGLKKFWTFRGSSGWVGTQNILYERDRDCHTSGSFSIGNR